MSALCYGQYLGVKTGSSPQRAAEICTGMQHPARWESVTYEYSQITDSHLELYS